MTLNEVIDQACKEPTLLDALSWIATWECERVIPEAHEFLSGRKERQVDGTGWTTCFHWLIKEVMEQYPQQKSIRKLKGTE